MDSRERLETTVRLDPRVQQVSLENPDYLEPREETDDPEHPGLKDHKEIRETLDSPDLLDHRDWTESTEREELLDQRERKEDLETKVIPDQGDPQEWRDPRATLEHQGSLVQLVNRDPEESKENLEALEITERRETVDSKETLEPLDNPENKDPPVNPELLDHQANKGTMGHRASRGTLDPLVLRVSREHLETRDLLDPRDLLDSGATLVRQETSESLDLQGKWDPPGKLGTLDRPVSREPEDGEDRRDTEERWEPLGLKENWVRRERLDRRARSGCPGRRENPVPSVRWE